MLRRFDRGFDPHDLAAAGIAAVVDQATLDAARAEVAKITVSEAIVGYIGQIVAATRMSPDLSLGASRGARSRSSSGARRWRRCGAGLRGSGGRQGHLRPGASPPADPPPGGGDPGCQRGGGGGAGGEPRADPR